jgi:predicted xylose isomerase-like sugar epimerase
MSAEAKRLLRLFRALRPESRLSLLDYAEFLAARAETVVPVPEGLVPRDIPRPGNESVVKAIRRLRETYFMLESKALFHEASALMTRHVMQGIPAVEVIDELEIVFRRHYEKGTAVSE